VEAQQSRFDLYANNYTDVVDRTITASGEKYDFFVELRIGLMLDRLRRDDPEFVPGFILDYGCGVGATGEVMRRLMPGVAILGIDESVESIRAARGRCLADAIFDVSGLDGSIPLPDMSIDLVYMNGSMHHICVDRRAAVMRELKRVLTPGGNLFVFENNPYNPLTRRAMAMNPFDAGCKKICKRELQGLGESAGFIVIEAWYYFFFPNCLSGLRRFDNKLKYLPFGGQYCVWFSA